MSDAVERYWEGQVDTHGAHALPGTAHVDDATAEAYAGFEPEPDYSQANAPVEQYQPEPGPGLDYGQESAYEPAEPDYGYEPSYEAPVEEFDVFGEPQEVTDQIRGLIRDELGSIGSDYSEQADEDLAARFEQQAAQEELEDIEGRRQMEAQLPSHVAAAIGPRAGAQEAGEMLAPDVYALADGAATELYQGLVAEGMTHEAAIQALQPHYAQLITSATAAARDLRGNEQIMREFRGGFRGGR